MGVTTPGAVLGAGSLNALPLSAAERQIFHVIRNLSGLSRVEIAAQTGLSKPTVSKALKKLADAGLVNEEREQPNGMGQPMIRITLRAAAMGLTGISLSTRGLYVAVCDLAGEPVWNSAPCDTPEPAQIIPAVLDLLADAVRATGGAGDVGLAVPGLLDRHGTICEITPRQSHIPFADLIAALRQARPDACVTASSRADLLHHALTPQGAGRVSFQLSMVDGIGGQVFDRDRAFIGGFNMAGNIGALAPDTGPRPSLPDLAAFLGVPVSDLTLDAIAARHAAGDPELAEWIRSRAAALSPGLAALVQLINPEQLVLGGNLPSRVIADLAAHLDFAAYDHPERMPLPRPLVIISDIIGEPARARAAACLPMARFIFGTT
ncbi:ROK family transcriptional regulator [Paracoccus sp. (in: a-proteobacteria)]|uniref:ROK family transcriptional regulator n=1 Tax=Paracoccus sp. TaxID=267 RepID=UPI0026E0B50D|nr:ROK family transcriptional regulator [Paracoccus sp. (in: a-proteobacteria)]MDO5647532.1 ROK family transcriptional regulator [Paracoccus sp. (in: a-proteobacteria)]